MGSDNGSIAVPRMSVKLMQGGCYGMKKRKNREIKKWALGGRCSGEKREKSVEEVEEEEEEVPVI